MRIFLNILFTFCSILDDAESENPYIPLQNRTNRTERESRNQESTITVNELDGILPPFEETSIEETDPESLATDQFESLFAQPLFFEEYSNEGQYYDFSNPNGWTIFKDATSSQISNSNTSENENNNAKTGRICPSQVGNSRSMLNYQHNNPEYDVTIINSSITNNRQILKNPNSNPSSQTVTFTNSNYQRQTGDNAAVKHKLKPGLVEFNRKRPKIEPSSLVYPPQTTAMTFSIQPTTSTKANITKKDFAEKYAINQQLTTESHPIAKKLKMASTSKRTALITELEENKDCPFDGKSFGGDTLKKYFEDSYFKVSKLVDNIDEELSNNLSPQNIKDRFIYGIFFEELLYIKDEFLFLIFVLPEIIVMTQSYTLLNTDCFDFTVFNKGLPRYKNAVKRLIFCYKGVMQQIKDNKAYINFKTIKEITNHFLKAMKTELVFFRRSNLYILKLGFDKCHSLKLYENTCNTDSKTMNISRSSWNLIKFFSIFLNQDWISHLSQETILFEQIKLTKKEQNFHDTFRTEKRRATLFVNLNLFVEMINLQYLSISGQSMSKYDLDVVKSTKKTISKTLNSVKNKLSEDLKYTLQAYLLYKYRKYCEELLSLYLSRHA